EVAVKPDDGRSIENAARILLQHDVDDCPSAVVDALQIDVDNALELVVGHLGKPGVLHDARVVDQGVDPMPGQHHALDHPRDALLVGNVDLEAERFASRCADLGKCLRDGVHVDIADGDLGAFLDELDRGRPAYALTSAGDDGNLARKSLAPCAIVRLPIRSVAVEPHASPSRTPLKRSGSRPFTAGDSTGFDCVAQCCSLMKHKSSSEVWLF